MVLKIAEALKSFLQSFLLYKSVLVDLEADMQAVPSLPLRWSTMALISELHGSAGEYIFLFVFIFVVIFVVIFGIG